MQTGQNNDDVNGKHFKFQNDCFSSEIEVI